MKLLFVISILFFTSVNSQTKINFDPDGYYFTKSIIKNGDWTFEWLAVLIKPTGGEKKTVSVRFRNLKTSKWIDIESKDYNICFDSLKINFSDNRVGALSFQGHYTYSKPNSQGKPQIATENIDYVGTFTLKNKTLPIKFSCGEGD